MLIALIYKLQIISSKIDRKALAFVTKDEETNHSDEVRKIIPNGSTAFFYVSRCVVFLFRDAMRANCLFLMCRSIRAGFFFIRYAMPCFLVCFNRFLAPLHKPIIKPMLSRFCPNFFHPCSFLPIPRKPPTVAIPQTFVLVLPGIFHQVARTLGQAPATSARPVAGCHDIFCANSKRLSKHQNIVP